MSKRRTGRSGWDVGVELWQWATAFGIAAFIYLSARLGSAERAVWTVLLLVVVPVALWRYGRGLQALLRSLLPEAPRLPRGWDGELSYVYEFHWPHEHMVAPDLAAWLDREFGAGRWGDRVAYVGRSVDALRRLLEHGRDGRSFVQPYGRIVLHPVPSREQMEALEVRLIREARRAGEPIVNKMLYEAA